MNRSIISYFPFYTFLNFSNFLQSFVNSKKKLWEDKYIKDRIYIERSYFYSFITKFDPGAWCLELLLFLSHLAIVPPTS